MEYLANPSLFILDEPDSGLDGVMARELFGHLRQIANQGKIVIVITHTPDRVIDPFDDVPCWPRMETVLTAGLFRPGGSGQDLLRQESMEEIVKSINRVEEGGEGRVDEFILKYEVQHGRVGHATTG